MLRDSWEIDESSFTQHHRYRHRPRNTSSTWSWHVIRSDTTRHYSTLVNHETYFQELEIRETLESWAFRLSPRPFSWTNGIQNEILDIIMAYKGE